MEPRSKFYRVRCKDCQNEMVIFNKTNTVVNCSVCDSLIATPQGGKAEFTGKIIQVLE